MKRIIIGDSQSRNLNSTDLELSRQVKKEKEENVGIFEPDVEVNDRYIGNNLNEIQQSQIDL